MVKGDMALHYRTPEGEEKILTVREGEIMHCPAGTPHSPRFAPDAFVLVLERKRRPDERDRFLWYCPGCGTKLYGVRGVLRERRQPHVLNVRSGRPAAQLAPFRLPNTYVGR